ncbi:MAG: ketopantoate reductase family protein [Alcanivorax sediminis]|uniref:ketopantoate reductase family protein n=1 Tax=Alcanivorax sediminis TaxID=2663008 RepID=UPI003C5E3ACF
MTTLLPHWYLVGAGNMGTLAAWHLLQAGHNVTVIKAGRGISLDKTLTLPDGHSTTLTLPVLPPDVITSPIDYLLVAVKTPYSEAAISAIKNKLHTDSLVIRFQNGLGALDGLLPTGTTILEAVSTSAVKGLHPHHQIVAENTTWLGGPMVEPDWLRGLQRHWPNLQWCENVHEPQWKKLVANVVINPLTALHDVPNGHVVDNPALRQQAALLCAEADAVLQALDPSWPGNSLDSVLAVARATAGNTSSMRADRQRGAVTEIEAINGWLVKQADKLGMAVPHNRRIVAQLTK